VVSVCVAVLVGQVAAAAPVVAAGPEWTPPVPGAVVRPFQEPLAVYAAGHRGVDFAAPAGSAVRAANSGVVSFAGNVAGSLHVVVAHGGGIRTSYSFLQRVDVRVGDRVERGQVVGAAGGAGDGHGAGVLHFGVRVGDRYVDPMLLFEPADLTQLVRLVPVDERDAAAMVDPAGDGRELFRWMQGEQSSQGDSSCGDLIGDLAGVFGLGDEADSACDAVGKAIGAGIDLLRRAGIIAADLAERATEVAAAVVDRMQNLDETLGRAAAAVAGAAGVAVVDLVEALVDLGIEIFERLTSCPQPDPVAHPAGSGNFVMAVAGQGSSRKRRADGSVTPSLHLEADVLGYRRSDVSYFSYAAKAAVYDRSATYGDLHAAAELLGQQIKAAALTQPGRHLDLVGHSQGGVVIDLFIMEVYRGHESEYPPIDNVVTFASPHEGTPTAGLGVKAARSIIGPEVERRVRVATEIQLDSPAMREVSTRSTTITRLWSQGGPPQRIRYLSIMGSLDPVVPSNVGDVPEKSKIVVPVGMALLPDDHSGILRDSDALSAAQAHLSGRRPADSCGLLVDLIGTEYSGAVAIATRAVSHLPESPSMRVVAPIPEGAP
jgi:hypothetical protein